MPGQGCLDRHLGGLRSRISPDHNNIGILAHQGANTRGKIKVDSRLDLALVKASTTISMGSSIVLTFTVSVARLFKVEYRVVVLPEPVGPVTSTMPWAR